MSKSPVHLLDIDEECEEEEIDSDSEDEIIRWQLYRSGGMESAKCAGRIESFLWETIVDVVDSNDWTTEREVLIEIIIEKVADFMRLPENAEWGASDSEPLHVLNDYVLDAIDDYFRRR